MAKVPDGKMVKKHHVLLFLNVGDKDSPDWKQIKKSTDNTITLNTETETFDYIADENPTEEVIRHAPSLSQPVTMYKGQPEYEYLFGKFFDQVVGNEAHTEILIVFTAHEPTANNYKAWKAGCTLVFDNMNPVDSTITVNINFAGTTAKGLVTVSQGIPSFVNDAVTEFAMTVTVRSSTATPVKDATVKIGGVTKITDENGKAIFNLIHGVTYPVIAYKGTDNVAGILEASSTTDTLSLTIE